MEKGNPLHCWWECKLVQPLWRTVWRFLKKLEIELPYDPAIPLLGTHTEETRIERDKHVVILAFYKEYAICSVENGLEGVKQKTGDNSEPIIVIWADHEEGLKKRKWVERIMSRRNENPHIHFQGVSKSSA